MWERLKKYVIEKTMKEEQRTVLAREPCAETLLPAVMIGFCLAASVAGWFGLQGMVPIMTQGLGRAGAEAWGAVERMMFFGGSTTTLMGGGIAGLAACWTLTIPSKDGQEPKVVFEDQLLIRLAGDLAKNYLGQQSATKLKDNVVTEAITRGLGLFALGASTFAIVMTVFVTLMGAVIQLNRQGASGILLPIAGGAAGAWVLSMLLCSRLLKNTPEK